MSDSEEVILLREIRLLMIRNEKLQLAILETLKSKLGAK